jgi:SpoVK/Ycf46/Vps4 family AAA+-type ATPase
MSSDGLLESLRAAVEALPEDVRLRMHLAEMLVASGDRQEAVRQAGAVLQRDPENVAALHLIADRSVGGAEPPDAAPSDTETLRRLDAELSDVAPARFVGEEAGGNWLVAEEVGLRLADVGGMQVVKERLEASFLAPLRNPDLLRLYGKSLRGGLLLYGPPGCGKTFIARALAGEMGAKFLSVSLPDVLDVYIGQSERNVRDIFDTARRNSPCILFFDEVDAIGQRRSHLRNSAARGTVNQLLTEMDGIGDANDGVYVLGATNHPWDLDVALRRPGRFDRMLLVLPPDEDARQAILRYHLRLRPIGGVDLARLAQLTDAYSGADLNSVCETAAEHALLSSARTGTARLIDMSDLELAIREVRPSIGPWLDTAKNVAQFANDGGAYDDLLSYLRTRRLI